MADPEKRDDPDSGPRMSLWDHLEELRRRLLFTVIAWLVGSSVAWIYLKPINDFIIYPARQMKLTLYARTPLEGIIILMKVDMAAGFLLTSPIVFYQFWAFIGPALKPNEKRLFFRFLAPVAVLFLLGVAFAFYPLMPLMLNFLVNYPKHFGIEPLITPESFIGFEMATALGCGITFQLPVITYILARIGLVTPKFLSVKWREIVFGLLIAAIIISPSPDVVSVMAFFAPLLLLYLVSYFVALAAAPKRKPPPSSPPSPPALPPA